ncbi:MAG TPA: hypothetical protein VN775_12310 [Opitutaceae bacterium]|nr:hypothetical protein [Opitutaceae bacterium]
MKDDDYRVIRKSIDAALQVIGEKPPGHGIELRIYEDLMKLREDVIRAQREGSGDTRGRPEIRSPGVGQS